MTLKEWLGSQRKRKRGNGPASRGTQSWLAARLGCEQALVSKWVRRVTTPEMYAERIIRLSGGKVTLEELKRIPPSRYWLSPVDGEP